MTSRERKHSALVVAVFGAMLFYVAIFAGTGTGLWSCPIRMVTSISCFGCGMTRSVTAFLHGDFLTSLKFHPFGPLFFVGFSSVAVVHGLEALRGTRLKWWPVAKAREFNKPIWGVFGVGVIGFGLYRMVSELFL